MRVELKGVHTVQRLLASGEVTFYYYAWRGGPRLHGEPGSPEFIRSYAAAHRTRHEPNPSLFRSIIAGFKASEEFKKLRERTKSDYLKQIAKIEIAFGDLPLDALDDPRVTREFFEWRDGMASSPRQADYGWTVLMRLMSWGRGRGLTAYRPPERITRLYRAGRSERTWSEAEIDAFMGVASVPLQCALILALESGQRQGDLLTLPWSAYDGAWIRLRQSKNGRRVNIPVTRRLRAMLENTPRAAITILTHSLRRPWKANAFRKAWGAASRKAGIIDLTFHDLRGTAVTRLSEAGCTPQEIATITGHSLRDLGAILDRYSARTDKLALAAIAKLERGKK
jgi:integrase